MRKLLKFTLFLSLGLLMGSTVYSQGREGFTKSPTGLTYKIYKVGKDTRKPAIGDWITIDMKYETKIHGKDTILFDNRTQKQHEPVTIELPRSDFRGDLYEGIQLLSPGDSGLFVINSDSLFIKTFRMPKRPETIDSNAAVTFTIRLYSFENPAELKIKEEQALQKYLADNKITAAPTASGIYIITSKEGEGVKIDTGYTVKLQFVVKKIDGKQIFSSYDRPEPLKFQYGKRFDTQGLQEAIGTMKKGQKALVIVPYTSGFGEKGRGSLVPPYATLLYEVEILDVMSKEDVDKEVAAEQKKVEETRTSAIQAETIALDKYLKDNNITVKPQPSGLYYIEKVKGTGPQGEAGKTVRVHYTGTFLDGKKFDSSRDRNEPLEFKLGTGRVIQGWEEGLSLMKAGGKAMIIVPSNLAYGDRGMGSIEPYTTLVFDLELVDVK